jgi:ABC-type transport system involved in Fe-S cluster assembly fused permease/ATPase subunit
MLSVNHVTKKYGKFTALKDVSFEFDGGVYGFLAPNGAGKTTLIKIIATLLFPTEGEISWAGTDILKFDAEYRAIVGYLPQDFGYYKGYSRGRHRGGRYKETPHSGYRVGAGCTVPASCGKTGDLSGLPVLSERSELMLLFFYIE